MKPDLSFLSVGGVVWCPVFVCPSSCDYVCTGIHGRPRIFWEIMAQHGVLQPIQTQELVSEMAYMGKFQSVSSQIAQDIVCSVFFRKVPEIPRQSGKFSLSALNPTRTRAVFRRITPLFVVFDSKMACLDHEFPDPFSCVLPCPPFSCSPPAH